MNLSAISPGGWITFGEQIDFKRTSEIVHKVHELGVNFFDGHNGRGISRKHVMESCHACLKRIGMDNRELSFFHRHDSEMPLVDFRAIDDLIH